MHVKEGYGDVEEGCDMLQVEDTDVRVVPFLLPGRVPVVLRPGPPPLGMCVAQVNARGHEWPMEVEEVGKIGSVLRHFLLG